MDPLTAFGLTCNLIQVIDFGLKTIKTCRDIHARGSTGENLDIAYVSNHLTELCSDIERSTPASLGQTSVFDKQLKDLAAQCAATAQELLAELKKLQVDPKDRVRLFKKTLETIWKRGRIVEAQKKLETYRKTLDTRILARLG